jgi:Arc/MetJ-type ribon-helix-helix transcriptional regulator
MASTTVHIPEHLLSQVDELAARRGTSRNRVVVEALEAAVNQDAGEWPEGIFDPPQREEERTLIAEAASELERAILANRQSARHWAE